MIMLSVYGLLIFMIVAAIIAIETRDILSSVVALSACGFGLAILFLFLGAPDLAFPQVVVEIITVVILIRAIPKRDSTQIKKHKDMFKVAVALLFMGLILGISIFVMKDFPAFGSPKMSVAKTYLKEAVGKTRAVNAVTAILLDFRAYDTLGEATVIFVSILGAIVVLRTIGRKKRKNFEDGGGA